jgi:low temperature requirement protein LtrA
VTALAPPTRVAWLEKFYDIVFVAVVGRFANELGNDPDLANTVEVLGWLAGLWMTWFLVTLRLNRFPDDRPATRLLLLIQLMALCVAAAAAISVTAVDDTRAVVGSAALGLTTAALYLGVLRSPLADPRLVAVPVALSLLVAAAELLTLLATPAWARLLPAVALLLQFVVVLGWYLPRVARGHPVEPVKAGDRHAQLFLVLMGLSFLKVAFAPDASGTVGYPVVVGSFLTGFALWSMYIDGVLPLGFPTGVSRQQVWLSVQLLLSLAVTVAAAAAVALPSSRTGGALPPAQALLEGGSLAAVLTALAVLAVSSQRTSAVRAAVRAAGALALVIVTALAIGAMPSDTFSTLAGSIVVVAAVVEALAGRWENRTLAQ